MYVVAEITRLAAISNYYVPTGHPFVVAFKFFYGDNNEEIADFWTTDLGVTEPLTLRTFITGVVYANAINYSVKESLAECLLDSQSYFWNNSDQVLYIHYNQLHHIDYNDPNFDIGIAVGLTNDKVRYFENRPYWPFLLDFPKIEVSVDKFNYDQLAFIVDTMQTDNRSGFFNQFKTTPIYGNKVSIKTGHEGNNYGDLVERANYYVDDYTFSADTFDIDIQDVRKTLTAQVPNTILNTTNYPDLGEHSIGKVIPFGYSPTDGFLHDVEGLLVNEGALNGTIKPDFLFLEVLRGSSLSDITVWIKDADDVWVEQTSGVSVDWPTGIVTIDGAETLSGSNYSAFPVKADVRGVDNVYASDVVKDLNARFLSLPYDSSNYNLTEWGQEESYLAPVSLYMKTTKDVYEWIKELQSLSTVGFRYTNTADNKRTIRIDNPNRDALFNIPAVNIKNVADVKAESNKEDVYNKIYIGYNKSIINDTAPRVENIDYFNESFAEYKIERVYNKTSGLINEADAIYRALMQAEDYFQIHKVFEVELIGEQYLDLRLYDVIKVNIDLRTRQLVSNSTWISSFSGDTKAAKVSSDSTVNLSLSTIVSSLVGDEYFGEVRGQIVSKQPNYELQTNTIRLREKEYSDLWTNIYSVASIVVSTSVVSGAIHITRDMNALSASVSTTPFLQGFVGLAYLAESSSDSVSDVSGQPNRIVQVSGSSISTTTIVSDLTSKSEVPATMIAFATSTSVNEWKKLDGVEATPSLINKYPRAASTEGGTGGTLTHTHAAYSGYSGLLGQALSRHNMTPQFQTHALSNTEAVRHQIDHTHSADTNHEPAHLKVLPITVGNELTNNMFLFYDGSTIPDGWEVESNAVDRHFKGSLTPNGTGGNTSHSHTHSGSSANNVPSGSANITESTNPAYYLWVPQGVGLNAHSHSIDHTHSGGVNEPAWHGLIPVKPSSSALIIPSGVCAFFTGSVVPSGWSAFNTADGKWIKGKSNAGDTGGSNTHNHTYSGNTGNFAGDPKASFNYASSTYHWYTQATTYHYHSMSHTHNTVDNIPPYQELMFLKKD